MMPPFPSPPMMVLTSRIMLTTLASPIADRVTKRMFALEGAEGESFTLFRQLLADVLCRTRECRFDFLFVASP